MFDSPQVDTVEHVFEYRAMLDVAIRRADGRTVVDLGQRTAPSLPVLPALEGLLPFGLRRGSTVSVSGSISLLLALLGASSAAGAWCALVGLPRISAEAAGEYGIDLSRLAVVPSTGSGWSTAVGALLDAVDVVAARPPARLVPGDVRRLAARARTRDAVLMPYLNSQDIRDAGWPGADVRLTVRDVQWTGAGDGHGRLMRRRLTVDVAGRGQAARPRSTALWLPAAGGGAGVVVQPVPISQSALVQPAAVPSVQLAAKAG